MSIPEERAIKEICVGKHGKQSMLRPLLLVSKRSKATTSEICDIVGDNVRVLAELWRDLGIDGTAMISRLEGTKRQISNIFTALREDQEEIKERLLRHISSYRSEVERLASELALTVNLPESRTLVQQEDEMRALVQRLREIRSSRMRELRRLRSQEEDLCNRLQESAFAFGNGGTIPSQEELHELRERLRALEQQKAQRTREFMALQREIVAHLHLVGAEPDTQFEREIVDSPETFTLSLQNLENTAAYLQKLKELWNERREEVAVLMEKLHIYSERLDVPEEEQLRRPTGLTADVIEMLKQELKRLDGLKRKRLHEFVQRTHDELIIWRQRCCVAQMLEEQDDPDDVSEGRLENMEEEIKMYKDLYNENIAIFTKIERREVLWAKFLELEKRSNDPCRFNRGGQPLLETKEHVRLQAELPRLEQEIRSDIKNYRGSKQEVFNRWGDQFLGYIAAQSEAYSLQKEQERLERAAGSGSTSSSSMVTSGRAAPSGRKPLGQTPRHVGGVSASAQNISIRRRFLKRSTQAKASKK